LSAKPWEFDIGWMWITILKFFGLAEVKRTIPQPMIDAGKMELDAESVKAILRTKMHVMSDYANDVIKPVLKEERQQVGRKMSKILKRAKRPMILDQERLSAKAEQRLAVALENSDTAKLIYEYREKLVVIWNQRYSSNEGLLKAMQEWVREAEQSGIESLRDFAESLKGWQLNTGTGAAA
jgi:stearoyl-CoA desaturase (delta-9 desaturase)